MANLLRRTPVGPTGRPVFAPPPAGWVNSRSGLVASHAAGGRKVYVTCAEDGCEGCTDRHFLIEWGESTRFAFNRAPVQETEWTERLEENVDRIIQKRKQEGF